MYSTFNIDINDLNVIEFYPYPSVVLYTLGMYDDIWSPGTGDKKVKILFEKVLEKANKEHSTNFLDNKIAFKFKHIPTKTMLYVGYKDGIYRLGLSVKQEYNKKVILK